MLFNLRRRAVELGVDARTQWLGHVSNEERIKLYAESTGVVYPPLDEDYGYVTLEAMLSSKPVITCTDSGAPLEFVVPGQTGLVCDPSPAALADAMDRLWSDREQARVLGGGGLEHYRSLGISWANAVRALLA
jgi:glycosyltransferase involved in cell wall biosynthesis